MSLVGNRLIWRVSRRGPRLAEANRHVESHRGVFNAKIFPSSSSRCGATVSARLSEGCKEVQLSLRTTVFRVGRGVRRCTHRHHVDVMNIHAASDTPAARCYASVQHVLTQACGGMPRLPTVVSSTLCLSKNFRRGHH